MWNIFISMFQIVLVENYKKIKVLHSYSRETDVKYRFEKLKSQVIFFPKTKIYRDKKLTDVNYEILLLKKRTDGDENRVIKNDLGKFVEEVSNDPDWVILDSAPYPIEETFNVSGANRKLTAKEIIEHIVIPNKNKKTPKQILMLNNKIVVEGLDLFLVTCKDTDETVRLYNKTKRITSYDS